MKVFDARETERLKEVDGKPLAPFGRRAAAFLTDLALMVALFAAAASLLIPLLIKYGYITDSDHIVFALNLNWYSITWTVFYFGVATYFGNGRTPGKRLFRIRVVSLVHQRISLWHSVERALGYAASLIEFGFSFFQLFIHPNKRTVHDRIAEPIVVVDPPRPESS